MDIQAKINICILSIMDHRYGYVNFYKIMFSKIKSSYHIIISFIDSSFAPLRTYETIIR